MTALENAFVKAGSSTALEPLAMVHVTIGRYINSIIRLRGLEARHCEVLDCNAVYFSYGAPYYRPANRQTEDALEFPIALVFDTDLISQIKRFYPFDTGGDAKGAFGAKWSATLRDLEQLHVEKEPERLVNCFYRSNQNYLVGKVEGRVRNIDPLPTIREFLAEDLSSGGADQRQRTIECVAETDIKILTSLRWVAYPDRSGFANLNSAISGNSVDNLG